MPRGFVVRTSCLLFGVFILCCLATAADAQFADKDPGGAKMGEEKVVRMQSGVIVKAAGGPCRGIVGYTAVPIEWPEQDVRIVAEDISPTAKVSYKIIGGSAKQMIIRIPNLPAGEEAKALVTFEITRREIVPPDDTDGYVIPNKAKLDRKVRIFLGTSPKIEVNDSRIRALARKLPAEEETAWEKVEAIYDWVRENVKYKNGPLKGAVAALKDGTGDCEELTSLFIAICRAANIPARTIWVEGHCYPEFYLEDAEGKGHWFPCEAAGTRSFGGIPNLSPILQKGDNMHPAYNTRDRQRYLAHHLTGTGGRPRVKFVRKVVGK
jgi:hypothetical protein